MRANWPILALFRPNWRETSIQANRKPDSNCRERLEARVGIEPTHKGFADLSLTTWVPRPCSIPQRSVTENFHLRSTSKTRKTGAGDGGRTRDIDLGKVALYH